MLNNFFTVCPGRSSDPTYNIKSNYCVKYSSRNLKLFCSEIKTKYREENEEKLIQVFRFEWKLKI